MWQWLFDNINGKHQEMKSQLRNDDEYFEFMIKDFNRRLQFAVFVGWILGAITVGVGIIIFLNNYK